MQSRFDSGTALPLPTLLAKTEITFFSRSDFLSSFVSLASNVTSLQNRSNSRLNSFKISSSSLSHYMCERSALDSSYRSYGEKTDDFQDYTFSISSGEIAGLGVEVESDANSYRAVLM